MIDALVFDFDGLILDTETSDYASWAQVYREHGCELLLEEWLVCVGGSAETFDPYARLAEQLGRPVDRDEIRPRRRALQAEMLLAEPILPAVESYIESAKEMGLKLAVASSSDIDWVTGHLSRLGLLEHFDAIRTANDVVHVKPDPALYLAVVDALNVQPRCALALEDSQNGLRAAKAAGLYCAVVPNPITQGLDFAEADLKLGSLAELPLLELIKKLSAIPLS